MGEGNDAHPAKRATPMPNCYRVCIQPRRLRRHVVAAAGPACEQLDTVAGLECPVPCLALSRLGLHCVIPFPSCHTCLRVLRKRWRARSLLSLFTSTAKVRRTPAAAAALEGCNCKQQGDCSTGTGKRWPSDCGASNAVAAPPAPTHSRNCCRVGTRAPGRPPICSDCS